MLENTKLTKNREGGYDAASLTTIIMWPKNIIEIFVIFFCLFFCQLNYFLNVYCKNLC